MNKQFSSKYNIGQSVAEGIYLELTKASDFLEKGSFDKAFEKYKSIKAKIPTTKISQVHKKKFKALNSYYLIAVTQKKANFKYNIIVKYNEILILSLDKNKMYLPSLKDISQFV